MLHFRPKNANNSGVLAAGWWVRIHLFLLQSVPFGSEVHPASYWNEYGSVFFGVKTAQMRSCPITFIQYQG